MLMSTIVQWMATNAIHSGALGPTNFYVVSYWHSKNKLVYFSTDLYIMQITITTLNLHIVKYGH